MTHGADGAATRRVRTVLASAASYRVLTLACSEPSEELVRALCTGELLAALRDSLEGIDADGAAVLDAFATASESSASMGAETVLEELQVEYARLFTGPGRTAVACFESQHREPPRGDGRGALGGRVAAAVEDAYREEGIALVAAGRQQPDHVATELAFLCTLRCRQARAWSAGEEEEAGRLDRAAGRFLRDHAASWLPSMAVEMRATTEALFYKAVADLLEVVLGAELPHVPDDSEARVAGRASRE